MFQSFASFAFVDVDLTWLPDGIVAGWEALMGIDPVMLLYGLPGYLILAVSMVSKLAARRNARKSVAMSPEAKQLVCSFENKGTKDEPYWQAHSECLLAYQPPATDDSIVGPACSFSLVPRWFGLRKPRLDITMPNGNSPQLSRKERKAVRALVYGMLDELAAEVEAERKEIERLKRENSVSQLARRNELARARAAMMGRRVPTTISASEMSGPGGYVNN